ncbi:hypothetical protein [Pontibacter rugosus]|uniref:Uncharacterized protein n=1 Tax=Pontibacter rugosus TaxID=1745966 RepID=A0ABW3SIN9_9BACT
MKEQESESNIYPVPKEQADAASNASTNGPDDVVRDENIPVIMIDTLAQEQNKSNQ